MTTQLSEDVLLQIAAPQILTMESAGGGGGGAGAARGAYSGSVELGRRLLLAARHGHTAHVLDLMAKGAPFTTDWLGTSPLHLAAGGAHADTCAVLLRAGASRDSRTKVERTPLHLAAHAGHAAVAALLLAHGAAVDARDMLRMTPLHWAAERGHAATAAVLLRHGADPLATSKFRKTPLSLAAARGRRDIEALLQDALRDREAARSVAALRRARADPADPTDAADEQTAYEVEIPAAEQQRALESIEKPQETAKPAAEQKTAAAEPIKADAQKPAEESGGAARAAALLRRHGITLLPHDASSTVLNALHSGRSVVLSDAGKLMLQESGSPPAGAPAAGKGVILTAAPVKSPPKPGVKIFTLNNKLLALPKENKAPAKKIVNAQDVQVKLAAPRPTLKARPRAGAPALRSPVKIIMHKGNYGKILKRNVDLAVPVPVTPAAELTKVLHGSGGAPAPPAPRGAGGAGAGGVVCVPQEFLSSNSTQYLRAQLLSAHQTIHTLHNEIADLKQQLARRPRDAS